MFDMTAVAYDKIHSIIEDEKKKEETLYLRVSMGIG
ncbi:hypothetical protein BCI9360_03809 [Bacillus sp. CECT 9360]|nr:hypothetical protein BCI9360_03809 [Bacillus sp. CECT 9360]